MHNKRPLSGLKIAIVHDWLTGIGGQEKVLLAWHKLFPDAPIYTSVYDRKNAPPEFRNMQIHTTWLQHVPFIRFRHQLVAPLRGLAFLSLKLKGYDVVLSMSSAESKFVRVDPKKTLHICYCNTPPRYYWSHYDDYKKNPGFGKLNPVIRLLMPFFVRIMRRMDFSAAQRVGVFIGNSKNVSERIKKYYRRSSYSLFPPVEIERFNLSSAKNRSGMLVAGRQIPYKRFDLAVKAANKLNLPLTVIGKGPEHQKLRSIAKNNVSFMTASDEMLGKKMSEAELLLFPGEEDAGIVPLEAIASGTPVVAYAKGGALEAVIDGKTGVLFKQQSVDSITEAINKALGKKWNPATIRKHAQNFSTENYLARLSAIIEAEYEKFQRIKS